MIAKFTLSAMMVILSVGTNNSLRANTKHFDRTTQAGFIAFLGDSLSTGAVAHPDLALTQAAMKSVLAGTMSYAPDEVYWEKVKEAGFLLDSGSEADPRRLYLASREFKDPMGWFLDHVGLVFSHKYLDAERYAWSYFLGRSLGYEPDSVWIAAKDGEKAEHATAQMARVLDESQGEAPDHIFMFFTGNDLCAATPEKTTPAESYASQLRSAIDYLVRNMKDKGKQQEPVHVWVLNPVGILQIVTKPSILRHRVAYGDDTISCKDLQTNQPKAEVMPLQDGGDISSVLLAASKTIPASYCPSLFQVHGKRGSDANILLSTRIRSYGEAIQKLTEEVRLAMADKKIYVNQIEATSQLIFNDKDMANDCFHLNINGQLKIAKAVREVIKQRINAAL